VCWRAGRVSVGFIIIEFQLYAESFRDVNLRATWTEK
jgi:hypothetical protein